MKSRPSGLSAVPPAEKPATPQSKLATPVSLIVPPVAVPVSTIVPTTSGDPPMSETVRVPPGSFGSWAPLTIIVLPKIPAIVHVPLRPEIVIVSARSAGWKSELPPTMSSWPSPPKITSLPAFPSM